MAVFHFVTRLGLALLCGAGIGFERQWRQRMAGLRTNALVAAGSALFALLGTLLPDSNPTRMAAQIASGIGFLGAGVIMREGLNVRGLNTAATLWCTAGVGTLAGCGFLLEAALGAMAIVTTNIVLRPLAGRINRQSLESTEVESLYRLRAICRQRDERQVRLQMLHEINHEALTVHSLQSRKLTDENRTEVSATIATVGSATAGLERVVSRLSLGGGVSAASWEILAQHDEIAVAQEENPSPPVDLPN